MIGRIPRLPQWIHESGQAKLPTNEVSGWSFDPALRDAVFSGISLRKNYK